MVFEIKIGTSVNEVLTFGTAAQKSVARIFDADNSMNYDANEVKLFNETIVSSKEDSLSLQHENVTITLSGDTDKYKLKDTSDKTTYDYSLLNTETKSVVSFDNSKKPSTINVNYNSKNKDENIFINNHRTALNNESIGINGGNANTYNVNISNSDVRTISTIRTKTSNIKLDNVYGDGYGLSKANIYTNSTDSLQLNNSRHFTQKTIDFNSVKTADQILTNNLFFNKK